MVKFKNRYILAQVVPDPVFCQNNADFTTGEIYRALWDAICSIHGDFGAGACKQSLQVKVFNEQTRIVLIRIGRGECEFMSSSMPFVSKIGRHPAMLRTIHVGGSVRSCEKALLRFHKLHLVASVPKAKTFEEKKLVMTVLKEASVQK